MKFENSLALFQHLLAIDETNMAQRLEDFVAQEHEFYVEVLALIKAHEENKKNTSFNALIGQQADTLVEDKSVHKLEGTQAGLYKLTKMLGQGGMGTVYLGERNDGQLEQKVAIKFVYPSIVALAGENFLQSEAQHLANVEHANIAKIYTVGSTEEKLPFMVMEYVDGLPIDQYCEQHQLSLNARIKLFQKVCLAVHAAHQNMIIHADIKPSNILVDKQGEPKLMDFGISRSINHTLENHAGEANVAKTYFNAASREFASPEQLAGKNLTLTCDIYSLGKLLSLLIRNQENKLSVREIKAVVDSKCLVSSEDRFQSVTDLVEALKLQQQGFGIDEYNKDIGYRISKYVTRNALAVASVSLVLGVLLSSSVILYWQNLNLIKQTEIATETSTFITDIFNSADQDNNQSLSVLELLGQGRKQLDDKSFSNVEVLATIKLTMSTAYKGIGEFDLSESLLLEALAPLDASQHKDLVYEINHRLSQLYTATSKLDLAQSLLEKNQQVPDLSKRQKLMNLYGFGDLYDTKGELEKAIEYFELTLAGHRSLENPDLDIIAIILNHLGGANKKLGNQQKGLELYLESLAISEELYGELAHPRIATRLSNIGALYSELEKYDQATLYLEKALKMFQTIAPEGHKKEAGVINNLGAIYLKKGDIPNALIYLELSLQKVTTLFGDKHVNTAILSNNIADTYRQNGQVDKALEMHARAISIFNDLGVAGIRLAVFKSNYAKSLLKANNLELALTEVNSAIDILSAVDNKHRGLAKLAQLKQQILAAQA